MTTTLPVTTMHLSRRTVLKGSGLDLAGFTLAQAGFLRSMAVESDAIQHILDFMATTEPFDETFLGEGLRHNNDGTYDQPWPDDVVAVVRTARAQEQFHLDAFPQAGDTPLADSFTVPPETLTSFDAFFSAVVEQETAENALQLRP